MSIPVRKAPAPPKPVSASAPLAGLTPTTVETPEGPKAALVVEGTTPLPPPGAARRDELARRDDNLGERLAAIEASLGLDSSGVAKPLAEQPIDREIAAVYDHTRVINPVEGYAYYWANERAAHGIDVTTHRTHGYAVVQGDMPENPDDRDARNYRVVGDVVLMRITLDKFEALQARRQRARQAMLGSVDTNLNAMGHRMRGKINVSELNPHQLQRLATQAQAQQIAGAITERRFREGGVPGLTPGR